MTTCMFLGCDNPLPDLPKGYGAGQWPVGWCEECNDKRRNGEQLPEYPPCLICGEPTDGPTICDDCLADDQEPDDPYEGNEHLDPDRIAAAIDRARDAQKGA